MNDKPRVLLVDDDEAFLELLSPLAEAQGLDVVLLASAEKALEFLEKQSVELIISDVQMPPGMSGTELFQRTRDTHPEIPVIFMTAFGSTEDAIQAVKQGAFHYFEKPLFDKLELFWTTVREGLTKGQMLRELALLRREKFLRMESPTTILGQSKAIRKLHECIQEVAPLPATVLIYGETGTGKELVARAVHQSSERHNKPFLAINCAGLAPGVLESELFGHEKGSFTGATNQKKGLFEAADHGTIFLDEISEAPLSFQAKLLRVLESKSFMRVGGTITVHSDFRILTATNRDLEGLVSSGEFRKDLFYRLNIYKMEIPPLRDRKEDIPILAEFYMHKFGEAYRRPIEGISMDAMLLLGEYDWPGNVRELINVMERSVITCRSGMITSKNLPFRRDDEYLPESCFNLKDAERFVIRLAIKRCKGNKTKAAKLLGISRKTLMDKVKIYNPDEEEDEE